MAMNATDKKTWNRAVLSIRWQADRHYEEHSIKFERPTDANPTPEHAVVAGGELSDRDLPMSSSWRHLFATVKVKSFDAYSLTVEYGVNEYTITPGKGVTLGTNGMNYTTFWLHLAVEDGVEISSGELFMRRFRMINRMQLSPDDVDELRKAAEKGNSVAEYAYARWLYAFMPTEASMSEAEEYLKKSMIYVPDALATYAQMLRSGDTKENVMDLEQSNKLLRKAAQQGSIRADLLMKHYRIFGQHCEAEPSKVADETERLLANNSDPDPHLHTLLGYAYEQLGRKEDALAQYELAVAKREYDSYYWMANIYHERGNMALYEEMMEEGVKKGSGICCIFRSDMAEDDYLQLSEREQKRIHNSIDSRLHLGLERGENLCAYYLWANNYFGGLGYKVNETEAAKYLKRGALMGCWLCIMEMAKLAEDRQWPEPLTSTDIAELWLRAVRYSPYNEKALRSLSRQTDTVFLLHHKDELERYWQPLFRQLPELPSDSSSPDGHLDHEDDDDGRYDAYV